MQPWRVYGASSAIFCHADVNMARGDELGMWLPRFVDLVGISDSLRCTASYDASLYGSGNLQHPVPGTEGGAVRRRCRHRRDPDIDIFSGHTPAEIAAGTSQCGHHDFESMPNHPKIIIVGAYDASGVNGPTYTNVHAAIIPVIAAGPLTSRQWAAPSSVIRAKRSTRRPSLWVTANNTSKTFRLPEPSSQIRVIRPAHGPSGARGCQRLPGSRAAGTPSHGQRDPALVWCRVS